VQCSQQNDLEFSLCYIEAVKLLKDAPEEALNKIFAGLKKHRAEDRKHVELVFNLQQAILDGLEYLEEEVSSRSEVFLLSKTTTSIVTMTTLYQK
jgi:hypothetical protein